MLHYLLLDTSIVKHKVVLELGCGTGFLSIALGIFGEKSLL
jgi:ribosomal protein L11 methylase PrmA